MSECHVAWIRMRRQVTIGSKVVAYTSTLGVAKTVGHVYALFVYVAVKPSAEYLDKYT